MQRDMPMNMEKAERMNCETKPYSSEHFVLLLQACARKGTVAGCHHRCKLLPHCHAYEDR